MLEGFLTRAGPVKTEAGPDVTIRRIVAPKPGPGCHESGGCGEGVDAEGYLYG